MRMEPWGTPKPETRKNEKPSETRLVKQNKILEICEVNEAR